MKVGSFSSYSPVSPSSRVLLDYYRGCVDGKDGPENLGPVVEHLVLDSKVTTLFHHTRLSSINKA